MGNSSSKSTKGLAQQEAERLAQFTCYLHCDGDKSSQLKAIKTNSTFGIRYVYFAPPKRLISKPINSAVIIIQDNSGIPVTQDSTWIYPKADNMKRTLIDNVEYENYTDFSQRGRRVTLRISRKNVMDSRIVYELPY